MANKRYIGWTEYGELIEGLRNLIPKDKYSGICGIPRGGLLIAIALSHYLDLPMYTYDPWILSPISEELLYVEDVVDTGQTVKHFLGDIATLFWKPWSEVKPTYWVKQTEDWIVFPYEKEE